MDPSVWFNQTINWAQKTGVNNAGDPVFAATVPIQCRIEVETSIARTGAKGTELEQGTIIYTTQKIAVEDRLWYPGDSPSSVDLTRAPMVSLAIVDRNGNVLYYKTTL